MQARAGVGREWLRYVDTQCYDGKTDAETDAGRILERIAEVIESVAVIEERSDAEVMGQVANDLDGPCNEVLTAVLDGLARRRALAGAGDDDGVALGILLADDVDRRELIEREAAHAVIAAGEESHDGREPVEVRHHGGTDFVTQQQVPF